MSDARDIKFLQEPRDITAGTSSSAVEGSPLKREAQRDIKRDERRKRMAKLIGALSDAAAQDKAVSSMRRDKESGISEAAMASEQYQRSLLS